ncbi:uncharacterized protein LOC142322694 [Lycorma delicatula]|uniref:uncharacterized protein LOC142322694 n=1 Tax=Lycorma delicatula TaxID=130591 RepID=UPI003F5131E2
MDTVYYVCEVLVALTAVAGNGLVLIAFRKERRLRRRTNYYIVSLAVADLLVGLLGIPCALLAYIGLPKQLHACLFTLSLLVVLCTISIFSLVAVSVDRYWAILYPMGYSRNVRTRTAICIICGCWVAGTLVGFLPLFGWNAAKLKNHELEACRFTQVMDYNFLVFIYVGTIIFPGVLMAAFYAHIYTVVVKQLRQMVTVNGTTGGSGAMLRVLGAARKREVKATQNLSVIVLFFMICWFPLYTINFIKAFRPDFPIPILLNNFFIILTHLNSAGNPLLYAYHLRDFRAALRSLLIGSPEVKKKTGGKDNSAYLHDNDNVIDNKIKNKQIKHSTTMMALNKNKQVIRIIPSDRFELTPKTPHRIFNLSVDSSMDLIRNDKDKTNNTFCKETRFNYNVLEESISHTDGGTQKEPKVSEIIKKNISESPLQFMDEPGNDMSNKVYSLGLQPLSPVRKNLNNNNGIISIFKCNCMQSNKSSYSNNIEDRISISEQDDIYNNKKEKTSEVETCKLPTDESKKATNIGNDTSNKCKCTATKTEIINFDNYYEIKEKIVNRTETEINNTDKSDYDNISITSSSTVIITNNYDSSKKSDEKEKNVSVKCKNNKIKNIPLNEMYMTNTDRSGTISSSPTILSDVSNTSQTDNDVIKVHNEINFSDSEEYIPVDIKKVDKLQKFPK